jgi:hypothetical protein
VPHRSLAHPGLSLCFGQQPHCSPKNFARWLYPFAFCLLCPTFRVGRLRVLGSDQALVAGGSDGKVQSERIRLSSSTIAAKSPQFDQRR